MTRRWSNVRVDGSSVTDPRVTAGETLIEGVISVTWDVDTENLPVLTLRIVGAEMDVPPAGAKR